MTATAKQWTPQELEGFRVFREYVETEWPAERGDVSDVQASIEGEPGAAEFAVIFKHRDRPGCMFGTRFDLDTLTVSNDRTVIVWANLNELIDASDMGLPTDCQSGEVTWL